MAADWSRFFLSAFVVQTLKRFDEEASGKSASLLIRSRVPTSARCSALALTAAHCALSYSCSRLAFDCPLSELLAPKPKKKPVQAALTEEQEEEKVSGG